MWYSYLQDYNVVKELFMYPRLDMEYVLMIVDIHKLEGNQPNNT